MAEDGVRVCEIPGSHQESAIAFAADMELVEIHGHIAARERQGAVPLVSDKEVAFHEPGTGCHRSVAGRTGRVSEDGPVGFHIGPRDEKRGRVSILVADHQVAFGVCDRCGGAENQTSGPGHRAAFLRCGGVDGECSSAGFHQPGSARGGAIDAKVEAVCVDGSGLIENPISRVVGDGACELECGAGAVEGHGTGVGAQCLPAAAFARTQRSSGKNRSSSEGIGAFEDQCACAVFYDRAAAFNPLGGAGGAIAVDGQVEAVVVDSSAEKERSRGVVRPGLRGREVQKGGDGGVRSPGVLDDARVAERDPRSGDFERWHGCRSVADGEPVDFVVPGIRFMGGQNGESEPGLVGGGVIGRRAAADPIRAIRPRRRVTAVPEDQGGLEVWLEDDRSESGLEDEEGFHGRAVLAGCSRAVNGVNPYSKL